MMDFISWHSFNTTPRPKRFMTALTHAFPRLGEIAPGEYSPPRVPLPRSWTLALSTIETPLGSDPEEPPTEPSAQKALTSDQEGAVSNNKVRVQMSKHEDMIPGIGHFTHHEHRKYSSYGACKQRLD